MEQTLVKIGNAGERRIAIIKESLHIYLGIVQGKLVLLLLLPLVLGPLASFSSQLIWNSW
jgi:hypothetical protein